jgi:hypothetical protein
VPWVAAQGDMIVRKKKESSMYVENLKSLKLIEETWKDIEEGRFHVRSKEAFFRELKE